MNQLNELNGWTDDKGITNFYFIKSLTKTQYFDRNKFSNNLELCLSKKMDTKSEFILKFYNITDIKIDLNISQLSGIDFEDISDRGWENCNYHLYNYEDTDFEFYFERYEIIKTPPNNK